MLCVVALVAAGETGADAGPAVPASLSEVVHSILGIVLKPQPRPVWPAGMCARQRGHRFTTTATGLNDGFVAEPPTPGDVPKLTARSAYRNFERMYGRLTDAERRTVQLRYGRLTDATMGPASANAIEYVPTTRRVSAWMVSSCAIFTAPPFAHRGRGTPGTLFFIIADTAKPRSLGWDYDYTDVHGTSIGFGGGGDALGIPRAGTTRFYSVPWRLVSMRPDRGRLLLRYRPIRCYALDHINVDEDGQAGTYITVILSDGPHRTCAAPSAIAPYMDAIAAPDKFGHLRHGPTGPLTFQGFSSQ